MRNLLIFHTNAKKSSIDNSQLTIFPRTHLVLRAISSESRTLNCVEFRFDFKFKFRSCSQHHEIASKLTYLKSNKMKWAN